MKKFFQKRWLILIVLIAAITGYFFFSQPKKEEKTYKVTKKNLKEELVFSGKVDAEEKAVLRFQTSGRLAWVRVKEGQAVKKYQTIASLDQRDLKNRLDKYLNTYAKQRNSFDQTIDDYQKTWTTAPDKLIADKAKRILENNQYDLNNAVLDVEYQNFTLEYANLWSPIDGVVTRIEVPTAGVNITPANAEFEIINPATLYFSASADQTEVVKLKEGMTGKITFDAYPDEPVDGTITMIGFTPKTDETGTVYEIKISFNSNKNLKLGMTGDVAFAISERNNVIALPQTLIKKDKKGAFVYLKQNNQTKKQYLKTDDEIDGEVIIENGLNPGDIVVDKKD
jgi:macrolide-specific efflux system membrane fusion protein